MIKPLIAKKSEFRKKGPGAISSNEPKVIWVKMHNRPKGQSQLLAARNKFNNILENLLSTKSGHFIMDINDKVAVPQNFSINNTLTSAGKEEFWWAVDRMIEVFDYKREKLLPLACEYTLTP